MLFIWSKQNLSVAHQFPHKRPTVHVAGHLPRRWHAPRPDLAAVRRRRRFRSATSSMGLR